MAPRITRVVCTVALGYALFLLPLAAADDRKPDWSGYTTVGDVVGEVVKADGKTLTLRVTWFVPPGGGNHRPGLGMNSGSFRNPYSPTMSRPRAGLKEEHHDYELGFVDNSLVRMKTLPPKLDEKGK